jgi:hypothetical protein
MSNPQFSLEAVLTGELTEPHPMMRLADAGETCRQAMYALNVTVEEAKRLTAFASKAFIMYANLKNTFAFPGGEVTLQQDHVETKLREYFDGPGRSCRVTYSQRQWHCWLHSDHGDSSASSRVGMLDAIANALMVAQAEVSNG